MLPCLGFCTLNLKKMDKVKFKFSRAKGDSFASRSRNVDFDRILLSHEPIRAAFGRISLYTER